jgi:acyl-CoA synthetase (AMP-forming)/AMP-acid ligase II
LEAVTRFGATLGWHPNFAYQFMADRVRDLQRGAYHQAADEEHAIDLSSLRLLVNCAEPVTARAQESFLEAYAPYGLRGDVLAGTWAMAETTFAVTYLPDSQHAELGSPTPNGRPAISVGYPLPGVEVEVRSAAGQPLPDGAIGELWVRAPFLASGYAGSSTATDEAFVDGWYRTGDLGHRRGNALYVQGRVKDVLIVAGHNIFPEDVEAAVGADPGIRGGRVAAAGVFDERLQTERVVVLAEPNGEHAPDRAGILRTLSAGLNLTGVRLVLVEPGWLVKSSSGKISRSQSLAKWQRELAEPLIPAPLTSHDAETPA